MILGRLSKILDVEFLTHSILSVHPWKLSLMSSHETGTIRESDQKSLRNQDIHRGMGVKKKGGR